MVVATIIKSSRQDSSAENGVVCAEPGGSRRGPGHEDGVGGA